MLVLGIAVTVATFGESELGAKLTIFRGQNLLQVFEAFIKLPRLLPVVSRNHAEVEEVTSHGILVRNHVWQKSRSPAEMDDSWFVHSKAFVGKEMKIRNIELRVLNVWYPETLAFCPERKERIGQSNSHAGISGVFIRFWNSVGFFRTLKLEILTQGCRFVPYTFSQAIRHRWYLRI